VTATGAERLGVLAHEMRNVLNSAILAFGSIKEGVVAISGSTSAILDRSHLRLQALIDRSLADVRLDVGLHDMESVAVLEILRDVAIGAALVAQPRGIHLTVTDPDPTVFVEGDRQILAAAVANLVQNAIKFTRPATTVRLRAMVTETRVLIEIEDECGGLPPGKAEDLFRPFEQRGSDRSGLGLGLAICHKAAKASAGELRVRDLPGQGCIFTLDLPRKPPPPPGLSSALGAPPFDRARPTT
jgi:signal transduction histidine kinase